MEEQNSKKANGSHAESDDSNGSFHLESGDSSINAENPEVPNGSSPEQGGKLKSALKTNIGSGGVKVGRASLFAHDGTYNPGGDGTEARRSVRISSGSNIDPDDVLCDSCIDDKKRAVKSCLVCQTSFCEIHLKPHLEGAAFRDHKLLEPIRDFEARKCQLHSKTMELFCQTDQTCICYLCMFQEHKNHSTVTVEAEKYVKETELSEIQEQLHLQLLDVDDEVERWHKEKDRIRNYTINQKAAVDHSIKELVRELQKQQEEVKVNLEQKERAAIDIIEQAVNDLQVKRDQLQDRQHDGDKLLHTTDAVLFLQEFQMVIRMAPPIPILPTYTVTLEGERLSQAMGGLRDELLTICKRNVEKICKNEISRNLVERNGDNRSFGGENRSFGGENRSFGGENRYMMKDMAPEWSQPNDSFGRFGSLFNMKAGGNNRTSGFQAASPGTGRTLAESSPQSLNSIYGTKGGNSQVSSYQFSSTVQTAATETSKQQDSNLFNMNVYPMTVRQQTTKALPQTWKSSKQSLLTQQRPFYVNKGNATHSNEAP
ncbi:tripartite motif-containing protein 29 isoform X2 [Ascaphus truei]|uniref:tripartite motif-containing protein 29 isoform X2 n=1 Tax=Ascaphus truei TaxID=8439 RepID=UPI003F597A1C